MTTNLSANASAPPAAKSADLFTRYGVWLCAAFYALLYFAFYPPMYTTMDESAYMNLAYTMRQGTLYSDVVGITTVFSYPVGPHIISQYPPGMSGLLAFGSFAGWHTTLGINLLMHLATFAVIVFILRRLRIPDLFALLYLFHPTAVTYSRTVMADLPSSLLFALAFLLYLRGRFGWCGMLLGLSTLIRNANIISVPLMMLACLLDTPDANREIQGRDWKRRIVSAVLVGVGAVPFYAAAYGYQAVYQQGGWAKFSTQLNPHHFPKGIRAYLLSLSLLYPGMIAAPLFYKKAGKAAVMLLPYGFVLMYSCYQFQDATGSALESFVIGQRYMLVVLPLWIVAYSGALWSLLQSPRVARVPRIVQRGVVAVLVLLMAGGTVAVHKKHQAFLQKTSAIRDSLVRAVPTSDVLLCNVHLAKLFHPGWGGPRQYFQTGGYNDDKADFKAAQEVVDSALKAGRPVVVASWSREYRAETGHEHTLVQNLVKAYRMRPFNESERQGLPSDVEIYTVGETPVGSQPGFIPVK